MKVRVIGIALAVAVVLTATSPVWSAPLPRTASGSTLDDPFRTGVLWLPVILSGRLLFIPVPVSLAPGLPEMTYLQGGDPVGDTPVWGRQDATVADTPVQQQQSGPVEDTPVWGQQSEPVDDTPVWGVKSGLS